MRPALCRLAFELLSLFDSALTCHVLDRPLMWLCGKSVPGHSFSVEMIVADQGATYVLDPHTRCRDCGARLTGEAYAMVIEQMDELAEESW